MIVVIDDERTFANDDRFVEPVIYLRNSSDGLVYLARQHCEHSLRYADPIKALYLDHDLGEDDDIRIVVEFLTLVPMTIENIYVHSQNPTTDWIVGTLMSRAYPRVKRIPLPELAPTPISSQELSDLANCINIGLHDTIVDNDGVCLHCGVREN